MSNELAKVFESVSGWKEYSHFEAEEEGYITQERMGDALAFFFWRVDREPVRLDHMFMDGFTFVRFHDNYY